MLAVDIGEPEVTKMYDLQYTDEQHLDAGSDSGNPSQITFLSVEPGKYSGTRSKPMVGNRKRRS
jgi:hypothetical protein